MILTEPLAYRLPFDDEIQEQIDELEMWRRIEGDARCRECGTTYFVLVPENARETDEIYLADLFKFLGNCHNHPQLVRWK